MKRILLLLLIVHLFHLVSGQVTPDSVQVDSTCSPPIYFLHKPSSDTMLNFSGDKQYAIVGKELEHPIRVLVLEGDSAPAAGVGVCFRLILSPKDKQDCKIIAPIAISDSNGIAQTTVVIGAQHGTYGVLASIKGQTTDAVYFDLHARKSKWVFFLIIGLIGGLGLFLLGMEMMSDGMQKSAGDKMRTILSKLTYNRFIAVGVGTFVTMLIQSSSATSVMLVSFVNSKLLRFKQTIGILLGAAIGTTITAQLIAFKLTDYSLLMIGVGFIFYLFTTKEKLQNIGEAILGFGILFFGMQIMSEAVYPLRTYSPFIDALIQLENPLIGIIVGAAFTALIQSSSAFVGIMIILAGQGLLTLEASVPLVLGSNIGTSITAILASLKANREAKKVAVAHTLFKVFGTLIIIWWIPGFVELIQKISPGSGAEYGQLPRQIANSHTLFNVIVVAALLPFTNAIAWLINKLIPAQLKDKRITKLAQLDEAVKKSPLLAMNLGKQEVVEMSKIILKMMDAIQEAILEKSEKCLIQVDKYEAQVDEYHDEINKFILELVKDKLGEQRAQEGYQIMYTSKEIEQIGDIIATNMRNRAEKWIKSSDSFTEKDKEELSGYFNKIRKQFKKSIVVFKEENLKKAKVLKDKSKEYREFAMDIEKEHFKNLYDDMLESEEKSKTIFEAIGMLNAINRHLSNIIRFYLKNG